MAVMQAAETYKLTRLAVAAQGGNDALGAALQAIIEEL